MSDYFATTRGQYIVPNEADVEIVVLTDRQCSSAILFSTTAIGATSGAATLLLRSALIGIRASSSDGPNFAAPVDIASLFRRKNGLEVRTWIESMLDDRLLGIADRPPDFGDPTVRDVEAGAEIGRGRGTGDPIIVESPGRLILRSANGTAITWFESNRPLTGVVPVPKVPPGVLGVNIGGPIFGTTLHPKTVSGGVGINCSSCSVCSVCAACAGCLVCGPSPAGAADVIGVDGVVGVAGVMGASLPFETLRDMGVVRPDWPM